MHHEIGPGVGDQAPTPVAIHEVVVFLAGDDDAGLQAFELSDDMAAQKARTAGDHDAATGEIHRGNWQDSSMPLRPGQATKR